MGFVRRRETGWTVPLEADHLVGRSSVAALRLTEGYVSSQHATIRWLGSAWELRDLGSRNGTFIDGMQVTAGVSLRLDRGAVLGFGHVEQAWELVDDAPPCAMAVPLVLGGTALLAADEMLAIPSASNPLATLFKGPDGSWLLERDDSSVQPLKNHELFEVGGLRYRFSCPDSVSATAASAVDALDERDVRRLRLRFTVSQDEEHVELWVHGMGSVSSLGARGHNYLLLLLARQRMTDATRGVPASECGWVYHDQLAKWLGATPERLNVNVFRIRRQFAALGLTNAADIIERRHGTRQLRLGSPYVQEGSE